MDGYLSLGHIVEGLDGNITCVKNALRLGTMQTHWL